MKLRAEQTQSPTVIQFASLRVPIFILKD